MRHKVIIENLYQNKKALGLVSMMAPVELMKALVKNLDLVPKDAARVVLDLKKRVEGISNPGIESNKMYPVPPQHRKDPEDDQQDEGVLGRPWGKDSYHGPAGFSRHQFPPDPREEPGEYPYDDVFVHYMNKPKRKKPIMNSREPKVKHKNPLDIDLRSGQPGGDGAGGGGIYRRSFHSRDNDTPGSGTSWSKQGKPGWSSSPKGKEFDVPPKSIKKSKPVELSQPVSGGQAKRPPNAGDNDGEPSFMKDPNVGQTIWDPKTGKSGTSNFRKKPWRGYSRR